MKRILITLIAAAAICGLSGCRQEKKSLETIANVESFDSSQPLTRDEIEPLLKSAMAVAPTRQVAAWRYYVLDGAAVSKIKPAIGDTYGAPAAIVVVGDSARFPENDAREFWAQDCAASTQKIMDAARLGGLQAKWLKVYPVQARVDRLARTLATKAGEVPFSVVLIGKSTAVTENDSCYNADLVEWRGFSQ